MWFGLKHHRYFLFWIVWLACWTLKEKNQIFNQGISPSYFHTSCYSLNSDFTKILLLQKYQYFGVVEYISHSICFKINGITEPKLSNGTNSLILFYGILLTYYVLNSPAITEKKIIPNWAVVISGLLDFFRKVDVRRYFSLKSGAGE